MACLRINETIANENKTRKFRSRGNLRLSDAGAMAISEDADVSSLRSTSGSRSSRILRPAAKCAMPAGAPETLDELLDRFAQAPGSRRLTNTGHLHSSLSRRDRTA